jgi:uncharacterized protein (TIGR03083 family)
VEPADGAPEVARLRRQFADQIVSLDEAAWDAASWCAGWRVRDVLAHLVRGAEMSYGSLTVDLLRGGFRPDASVRKAARRLGDTPVAELADRLRAAADRRFHLVGSSEGMGLADVIVHSADAFRPVGLEVEVAPAHVVRAVDTLWTRGRVVVHAVPQQGRRLVAKDTDWSRGSGPEVVGKSLDLLLFVANRRQVLPRLEGPGVAGL